MRERRVYNSNEQADGDVSFKEKKGLEEEKMGGLDGGDTLSPKYLLDLQVETSTVGLELSRSQLEA